MSAADVLSVFVAFSVVYALGCAVGWSVGFTRGHRKGISDAMHAEADTRDPRVQSDGYGGDIGHLDAWQLPDALSLHDEDR